MYITGVEVEHVSQIHHRGPIMVDTHLHPAEKEEEKKKHIKGFVSQIIVNSYRKAVEWF